MKTIVLGIMILVITLSACNDSGVSTTSEPTQKKFISILDSSLTITASLHNGSDKPTVIVRGKILYRVEIESVALLSVKLQYSFSAKPLDVSGKSKSYGQLDSIIINDTLKNVLPFTNKPLKKIQLKLRVNDLNITSTEVVDLNIKAFCKWEGNPEPGILNIPLRSNQSVRTGDIFWARNGSGFYFHISRNESEIVCFYSLTTSSIDEITPPNMLLRAFEETPDGKYLLLADNNAQPSNIYLFDLTSRTMATLIPARDSLIVTSASCSANGKTIAFTTMPTGHVAYAISMWLFDRTDASLKQVNPTSLPSYQTITGWVQGSNDKIVFHMNFMDILFFSISNQATSRVYYSYNFYPRNLLADRFSVLGSFTFQNISFDVIEVGEIQLALFDITGQPVKQLTFSPGLIFDYAIAPDGSKLAFSAYRNTTKALELFLLPLQGHILAKSQ
ncbi:MAG: PD40 domain-containing protein [Ignavibacteriales bacterium]|nr:PD40 domain-containing protein [Ignavibacteriales bacterium]